MRTDALLPLGLATVLLYLHVALAATIPTSTTSGYTTTTILDTTTTPGIPTATSDNLQTTTTTVPQTTTATVHQTTTTVPQTTTANIITTVPQTTTENIIITTVSETTTPEIPETTVSVIPETTTIMPQTTITTFSPTTTKPATPKPGTACWLGGDVLCAIICIDKYGFLAGGCCGESWTKCSGTCYCNGIGETDVPTGYKEFPGHAVGEDGVVRAIRDTDSLAQEVINATGCMNEAYVLECLCDCDYDVDATIAYVLQTMETMNGYQEDTTSLASQMTSTDSGIWSENSSTPTKGQKDDIGVDVNHNGLGVKGHYREDSYGGSSGYGSVNSHNGGARPKVNIQPAVVPEAKASSVKLNSKQTKKQKKMEKKKRAEEKHKMKHLGLEPRVMDDDNDDVVTVISRDLQVARI